MFFPHTYTSNFCSAPPKICFWLVFPFSFFSYRYFFFFFFVFSLAFVVYAASRETLPVYGLHTVCVHVFSVFSFPDGNSFVCVHRWIRTERAHVFVCDAKHNSDICVFVWWMTAIRVTVTLAVLITVYFCIFSLTPTHEIGGLCALAIVPHIRPGESHEFCCCCFFFSVCSFVCLFRICRCVGNRLNVARAILLSLSFIQPLSLHHIEANFP